MINSFFSFYLFFFRKPTIFHLSDLVSTWSLFEGLLNYALKNVFNFFATRYSDCVTSNKFYSTNHPRFTHSHFAWHIPTGSALTVYCVYVCFFNFSISFFSHFSEYVKIYPMNNFIFTFWIVGFVWCN